MGPAVIRHLIYGINFLFILIGCVLISVAVSTKIFYNRYGDLVPAQYSYLCLYFICLGFVLFLVALLGWYVALSDNASITLMFSTCLLLVFFLEMTGAVAGYFLKTTTYHSLSSTLNIMDKRSDIQEGHWTNLQQDFSCCGVESPEDWLASDGSLPNSCCSHMRNGRKEKRHGNCRMHSNDTFSGGCFRPMEAFLRDNSVLCIVLGVIAGSFQIFGLLMVCHLTSQFRKDYLLI